MNNRAIVVTVAGASAAVALLAGPASGAAQVKPKAGSFSGTIAQPYPTPGHPHHQGAPISFVVPKGGTQITGLTGSVAVKNGCKRKFNEYQLPVPQPPAFAPIMVTAGRFSGSESDYIGPKVRVTISGTFVSATKATGHVVVRFANNGAKCNVTRAFTAQRG